MEIKRPNRRLINMVNKIIFGIATFIIGVFTIGFILSIIGALADSFVLMNFGVNALLIAYGIIIGSILLFIVGAMFDKFRSM